MRLGNFAPRYCHAWGAQPLPAKGDQHHRRTQEGRGQRSKGRAEKEETQGERTTAKDPTRQDTKNHHHRKGHRRRRHHGPTAQQLAWPAAIVGVYFTVGLFLNMIIEDGIQTRTLVENFMGYLAILT